MENITSYIIEDNNKISFDKLAFKKDNYVLVQIDYMGFYVPRIWLYKFNYLYNLLENEDFMIKSYKVTESGYHYIDLTKDFIDTAEINKIEFREFKYLFFDVLSGRRNIKNHITKYAIEFFNFLGLERELYENLKQVNNC